MDGKNRKSEKLAKVIERLVDSKKVNVIDTGEPTEKPDESQVGPLNFKPTPDEADPETEPPKSAPSADD